MSASALELESLVLKIIGDNRDAMRALSEVRREVEAFSTDFKKGASGFAGEFKREKKKAEKDTGDFKPYQFKNQQEMVGYLNQLRYNSRKMQDELEEAEKAATFKKRSDAAKKGVATKARNKIAAEKEAAEAKSFAEKMTGYKAKLRVDSKKLEEQGVDDARKAGQKKWDDWSKQSRKQGDVERKRLNKINQDALDAQDRVDNYRSKKAKDMEVYKKQLRYNSKRLEEQELEDARKNGQKKWEAWASSSRKVGDKARKEQAREEKKVLREGQAEINRAWREDQKELRKQAREKRAAERAELKEGQRQINQAWKEDKAKQREAKKAAANAAREAANAHKQNARNAAKERKDAERVEKQKARDAEKVKRQQEAKDRERAESNKEFRENLAKGTVQTGLVVSAGTGMIGAGIMSGLAGTVDEYAKFNLAMTQSTSVMDVTDKQVIRMKKNLFELAEKGPQAPAELAKAYYYLASAGLSAEASIKALPAVQAFATAGAFDVERATSLALNAQSAMGMKSQDANENLRNLKRVTDVITKAAMISDATVEQMAASFTRQAGPALRAFGKTVEEGAAILAVYADQGDKGVTAGTHLSMVLRHLSEAAVKHRAEFEALGVGVFDANGNMRDMGKIAVDLGKKLGPMGDAMRTKTLLKMGFQAKLQQSLFPLMGMGEQYERFLKQIKGSEGTTENIQAKQMEAFTNQMLVMKNTIIMTAIEIGGLLAPSLLQLGGLVRNAMTWFRELNPEILKFGVTIVTAVGLITTATATLIGPLALGLMLFGPKVLLIGTILTGLVVTVGLFAGAMIQGAGGMEKVLNNAVNALKQFWEWMGPVRKAFDGFVKAVVGALPQAFEYLSKVVKQFWDSMGGNTINWNVMRDNVQMFFVFAEYTIKNFDTVGRFLWVGFQWKAVQAFNTILANFVVFTNAMGPVMVAMDGNWSKVLGNMTKNAGKGFGRMWDLFVIGQRLAWARAFGSKEDVDKILKEKEEKFGKSNTFKFTKFGIEVGSMKELENDLKKEFDRLNGEVGWDSNKWKEFRDRRLKEMGLADVPFQNTKLPGLNLQFKDAQKAVEQYAPGDWMEKQFGKFDHAAYGTQEALLRIEEQMNSMMVRLPESVMPDAPNVNSNVGLRMTRRTDFEQLTGHDFLRRIADGIDQMVDNTEEGGIRIDAANFTG